MILRPLTTEDAEDVFAYASDAEVTRYMLWEAHRSAGDSRAFLNDVVEGYGKGDFATWGLTLKGDDRVVGTCGYDGAWVPRHARAELGYALARGHWNRGLTTEAVRTVVRFGFEVMKLNKVVARCFVGNAASERVMQKAGMTYEGTQRQHVFIKDAYRDLKVYSILRDEFRGGAA